MNKDRFEKTLTKLNSFSENGKGLNRLAYSVQEKNAVSFLINELIKEDLEVNEDTAGNIMAKRKGRNTNLKPVAMGSHIDTVYEGGRFDGSIGVIAGLEIIRFLNEHNIITERTIEIIIFACEESSRFGTSTIGSKSLSGQLKLHELKKLEDKNNVSFEDAIRTRGLEINKFLECKLEKNSIYSFIELHIEQGPVLDKDKLDIGIVTDIAAPTRFQIEFIGESSHSGTTPMTYRKDAFLAACEFALILEELALEEKRFNTVGTVGECIVNPGAMNVVPGDTLVKVDIRGISSDSINRVVEKLYSNMEKIKEKRKIKSNIEVLSQEKPVKMSQSVVDILKKQCSNLDYSYVEMYSGAGHDAMNMSKLCPTAMIFVPSKNGLSHNPEEFTSMDQIMKGVVLLKDTVIELANELVEE